MADYRSVRMVALLVALVVLGATAFKTAALSSGGGEVAASMGGTLVPPTVQDPLLSRGDPLGLRQRLTGRAVAISTRIELVHLMVAIGAQPPMPAKYRSTAGFDGTHDLVLGGGHPVPLSIRRSKSAKDVTDLRAWPPLLRLMSRDGPMCQHVYARRLRR